MSQNSRKTLQKAIGASYSMLGALALFGFGGYWLDRYRESENFWLIIGLLLGVVIGMYELAKYILKK
jgi:F0F1-type ATP synthase assembly protein I